MTPTHTRTPVGTPDTLRTTTRKVTRTRKPKKATAKRTTTTWGKSLAAQAKLTGLWVKDSDTGEWTSLYARLVGPDWHLATTLHEQADDPKQAVHLYADTLEAEGHKVRHHSESKGAAKARATKQARFNA